MTARDCHLSGGDRETSFTQVVTGLDQSLAVGAVDCAENAPGGGKTHDRRPPSGLAAKTLRERSAEIVAGDADEVDKIPRSFEIHRGHVPGIRHDTDGR